MPVIARSMFDALVDLRLLLKSSDYLQEMKLRDAIGEARWLKRMIAAREAVGGAPDGVEKMEIGHKAAVDWCQRLRDDGARKPRKMDQRLDDADLNPALRSAFRWLNAATHSDISALKERHMRGEGLRFWVGVSDRKKASTLHTGGLFVLSALRELTTLTADGDSFDASVRWAFIPYTEFGNLLPPPPWDRKEKTSNEIP